MQGVPNSERLGDAVLDPAVKRYAHLDMCRNMAVVLVAIDHGTKMFSEHNVYFSQCWTLQVLWVVSGVSWTLTRKPLGGYCLRLGAYFCAGVFFNWCGWVYRGADWRADWHNVIFHMFFIVGLILFAVVTAPMKPLFVDARDRIKQCSSSKSREHDTVQETPVPQKSDDEVSDGICPMTIGRQEVSDAQGDGEEAPLHGGHDEESGNRSTREVTSSTSTSSDGRCLTAFWSLFFVMLVAQTAAGVLDHHLSKKGSIWKFLSKSDKEGWAYWVSDFNLTKTIGQLSISGGVLFLAWFGGKFVSSPHTASWVVWGVLLYSYYGRIFLVHFLFGTSKADRLFVGFDLFTIGLTAGTLGIKGRATMRKWLSRYYVVFFLAMQFLWDPTWDLRLDEHPPQDFVNMFRFKISEFGWIVGFLVCGEIMFDPKIFTEDKMYWVNDWCLLLFLVHKFIHDVVPSPFSWLLGLSFLPLVWMIRRGPKYVKLCPCAPRKS